MIMAMEQLAFNQHDKNKGAQHIGVPRILSYGAVQHVYWRTRILWSRGRIPQAINIDPASGVILNPSH